MQPPVLHPFPTRRSSDLKRVAEQGDVRLGDIRATLPANFDSDQAVGFERAQRVAHRDATDAKLLGHLSLGWQTIRSEEHTSELQSLAYLVCRPLLEKKRR